MQKEEQTMSQTETNQENIIPTGYMKDAKGRLVPENVIKPEEKLEDQLVTKVMSFADDLSSQVSRFKGHVFDDVGAFMETLSDQYGVKKGGAKGNVTLKSYDGLQKVSVAVQDHIDFGPELQIAKQLIDECMAEWAEGTQPELRAYINEAFNTEKKGQVNREALFRLRRIESDDERWQNAVEAINSSIRVTGSKTYVRFYRREKPEDKFQAVTIDLANA